GPEGGQWRVLLSRRLGKADAFDGVVMAGLEIESFERLYRAIDLGEGGFITPLSPNGTLLTRGPDPGGVRGRQFTGGAVLSGVRQHGSFSGWANSRVSQERVLLAASTVRGFPLFVASGASERAVFAPWRDEAWLVFDRTLLTSGAMLTLIGLAAWGLARRERALGNSWRRHQALSERSSDAQLLPRPLADAVVSG